MVHLGTIVAGLGLVILLHSGYSTAHFQQFKPAGAGDSPPLDAVIEVYALQCSRLYFPHSTTDSTGFCFTLVVLVVLRGFRLEIPRSKMANAVSG